jgi:DNA-binding MarR family transcriptional regulator
MVNGGDRSPEAEAEGEVGERGGRRGALGGALRRAWVGYRRRLDQELAAAGFGDRAFPDGRVLRICSRSPEVTISHIGRELGITRQGASKIVAGLRERGYVTVDASPTSGREKAVRLTTRAIDYLAAQRQAARDIERQLRAEIGAEAFDSLDLLLEALGGDDQPRMDDYLRSASNTDDSGHP